VTRPKKRDPSTAAAPPAVPELRPGWKAVRDEAMDQGDIQTLLDALAEAGEKAVIMRVRGDQMAYVTTIPASEFSLAWLKQHLGGGKYKVNVIGRTLKGDKVKTTAVFAIEGMPREYTADIEPTPGAPAAAAPAQSDLQAMQTTMLTMTLTAMKGLAEAFSAMAKPQPQVDPLAMLEKAASIFRHSEPARTPANEIASAIREGMELGQLAGGGGGGSGGDAALSAIAPAVGPLAQALADRLTAETALKRAQALRFHKPVPALPTGAPDTGGDVKQPAATPTLPTFGDWRDQLTPFVPFFLSLAKTGKSARAEAVRLLEEAPARVRDHLEVAINGEPTPDAFVTQLLESYPPMRDPAVVGWFREFLEEVDAQLRDTDHADDQGADDE
jgi:hypothetical protein